MKLLFSISIKIEGGKSLCLAFHKAATIKLPKDISNAKKAVIGATSPPMYSGMPGANRHKAIPETPIFSISGILSVTRTRRALCCY